MRLLLRLIPIVALLWTGMAAHSAPPSASIFVKTLADEVLAIFNDPRLTLPEQEQRMYRVALRDFDVAYTARFALGPYWRTASEAERKEFMDAYERYVVHVYAGQFRVNHDVTFKVALERQEGSVGTLVRTDIVRHDGRPPMMLDWHVAKSAESYKVIDVSVEGISQLVTFREQFAAIIQQNQGSVSALTALLREKTAS